MKLGTGIILGVVAAAGVGVGYYYLRQITLLKTLKYEMIGFNPGDITADMTTAVITIRITSNSTINAQVNDLYIDVTINGTRLGTIEDKSPFVIPAKGYSDVNLSIAFSPKIIFANAVSLLTDYTGTQDFAINLNGYVNIKSAFISVSVPFVYATSLKQYLSPL